MLKQFLAFRRLDRGFGLHDQYHQLRGRTKASTTSGTKKKKSGTTSTTIMMMASGLGSSSKTLLQHSEVVREMAADIARVSMRRSTIWWTRTRRSWSTMLTSPSRSGLNR